MTLVRCRTLRVSPAALTTALLQHSFGGVATEREIVRRGFRFMDTLESEYKADIDDTTFGIAKYDEPWRLVGRHNEIHVRKAGKKNKNTK